MASRARQFFEQITGYTNPPEFLKRLVATRRPENEFLDFKSGKAQEKDAKRLWSEALSGFANTEGGVVVWGIDARREASPDDPSVKLDTACGFLYVEKPTSFAQILKDWQLEATEEAPGGVEIVPYPSEPDGSGFIVCYVPEGRQKPYRASRAQDRQYYIRIGSSFTVIPHALLRTLFYPQFTPSFGVVVELVYSTGHGQHPAIEFRGSLVNTGLATAEGMRVVIKASRPEVQLGTGWHWQAYAAKDGRLTMRSTQPLHPSDSMWLFSAQWHSDEILNPIPKSVEEIVARHWHPSWEDVVFHIRIYAHNQQPFTMAARFDRGELAHGVRKTGVQTDEFPDAPVWGQWP